MHKLNFITILDFGQHPLFEWLYRRFLEWVVYSSIWVAAAIASLGAFAQAIMGLAFDWRPIALIFAAALVPYNLDRIFDSYVQIIPEDREQAYFRQPGIFLLLLVAVGATAALLYEAPTQVRLVSCAGIVPLLYGTPLFPWRRDDKIRWYRLKDIPGSKAWLVGGTLTYAAIALPLAYAAKGFDVVSAFTTVFLFVFIVTNSHTFDIRDLESDRQKGVTTLPLMVGVRGTKIILTGLNLFMLLALFWGWSTGIAFQSEVLIATGITLGYLWTVDVDTPRPVFSIVIDGCLFVPALISWVELKLLAISS